MGQPADSSLNVRNYSRTSTLFGRIHRPIRAPYGVVEFFAGRALYNSCGKSDLELLGEVGNLHCTNSVRDALENTDRVAKHCISHQQDEFLAAPSRELVTRPQCWSGVAMLAASTR